MYQGTPLRECTKDDVLKVLERQAQILNELARICASIQSALMGKLDECEKAQKGDDHELV